MKKIIKYFIAYYGDNNHLVWQAEKKRFIPAGLLLYRTTYDSLEDAMKEAHKAKHICSGWYDNIYIDSEICYC